MDVRFDEAAGSGGSGGGAAVHELASAFGSVGVDFEYADLSRG
jgi:hypothetical protein